MENDFIEPVEATDWGLDEIIAEEASKEADILAFATDKISEEALTKALMSSNDAQIWPGSLKEATNALRRGQNPKIIIVDTDTTLYPAGAVYELAQVCEQGTSVIAFGNDAGAMFSREMLKLGLSDYLVKPIRPKAIAESIARVRSGGTFQNKEGKLIAVTGSPGSGVSTIAAALTTCASEYGHYVSVLDLNRTFATLAFLLDVEPSQGLVEMLSTAARASLHPEAIKSIGAKRGDRINVYAYAWSASPIPLAPAWAICEMLVELQKRSHIVILDGMDDAATRQTLLAVADTRIVVFEPTRAGTVMAADLIRKLKPMRSEESPVIVVSNETRQTERHEKRRENGVPQPGEKPSVEVAYNAAIAQTANRGWNNEKVPKEIQSQMKQVLENVVGTETSNKSTAKETQSMLQIARKLLRPKNHTEKTQ